MASMHCLPQSTVRLITSSQAITSIQSVVKELVENSLDAGAESVEVRLENFGLDKIEVKDNGSGISTENIPYMAKKHYTSKISSDADFSSLSTLGFRGEALGAIAALACLSVTTRCPVEQIGRSYSFDSKGNVTNEKSVPTTIGTTVCVAGIYKSVPVRRQYYSSKSQLRVVIKAVQDLLMAYATISYDTRFLLKHNKSVVWQKSCYKSTEEAMQAVTSCTITKDFTTLSTTNDQVAEDEFHYSMIIPKLENRSNQKFFRSNSDFMFLYVNGRPIQDKTIVKVVREIICPEHLSHKYPVCLVKIEVSPSSVDVNVEPDKSRVLIVDQENLMEALRKKLTDFYVGCTPLTTEPSTAEAGFEMLQDLPNREENVAEDEPRPNGALADKPEDPLDECVIPKSTALKTSDSAPFDSLPSSPEDVFNMSINLRPDNQDGTIEKSATDGEQGQGESSALFTDEPLRSPLRESNAGLSSMRELEHDSLEFFSLSDSDCDDFPLFSITSDSGVAFHANKPVDVAQAVDQTNKLETTIVPVTRANAEQEITINSSNEETALGDVNTSTQTELRNSMELLLTSTDKVPESSPHIDSPSSPIVTGDSLRIPDMTRPSEDQGHLASTPGSQRHTQSSLSQFFQVPTRDEAFKRGTTPKTDICVEPPSFTASQWARGNITPKEPVVLLRPEPKINSYLTPPHDPQASSTIRIDPESDVQVLRVIQSDCGDTRPARKKRKYKNHQCNNVEDNDDQPKSKRSHRSPINLRRASPEMYDVVFDMVELKQKYAEGLPPKQLSSSSDQFMYIGIPKTCYGCIASHKQKLYGFNVHKYKEHVLYARYIQEYVVPSEEMTEPLLVILDPSGEHDSENLAVLPDLPLNGFTVSTHAEGLTVHKKPVGLLESCIENELTSIVSAHTTASMEYTPRPYRTEKTKQLIMSEVVREVRQIESHNFRSLISDVNKNSCEPTSWIEINCPIHGKPIFTHLADLSAH